MKIDVLDHGFVELQDLMGNDLAIVNAARTSYLGESKGEESDKKLLFYLMEHGHHSPFEMVEFKFRVRAPAICWWQWTRSRTQSYNFQSGRYTQLSDQMYVPTEWRLQDTQNKQGSEGISPDSEDITLLADAMFQASYKLYQRFLDAGIAREQARFVLPFLVMYYTAIVKVDCRNLMHFLKLRTSDKAQYEIRQYALAIEQIFKTHLPWTWEAYKEYYK